MKFYDATLTLSEQTVPWPGDERFSREEKQGSAIVSRIQTSSHIGTHIDAPRHFLFDRTGIDRIPPGKLIGRARVVASKARFQISLSEVRALKPGAGDKILFKTRNARLLRAKKFTADYVSLSLAAAEYLAAKKIDLVGIDYLGIEAKSAPGHPVHKALLAAGIVIVEGADLAKVPAGTYMLAALPMKIKDGDGSPARVMLWQ